MNITIARQQITLLPQKAIYWNSKKILLIADTHFGKTATFLQEGLSIPQSNTVDDVMRINLLLNRTGAKEIIFLGDFFHAKSSKSKKVINELLEWRSAHPGIKMTLVRGNHDKMSGDPPEELNIICCEEPCEIRPFAFRHSPAETSGYFSFAGHVHPAVRLRGRGKERVRLSCFYFTRNYCILPSFGSFTGTYDVHPEESDRVFVTTGDEVIEVK